MSALRLPEIGEARAVRLFHAVCGLSVAAGVALVVWGWAASRPFWYDEHFSLVVAQWLLESPGAAMAGLVLPDVHPPLYYVLLAAWTRLFGVGEMAVRSLSLLGCLGALGILWWRGRPMLSRAALCLALLWLSTNWIWANYAVEARMYGLLLCGGAWVSLAFARLWMAGHAPGSVALWPLCLVGLPFAFLHYSGMTLFCSALLLLLLRYRRHWPLWPPVLAAGLPCAAWVAYHGLHSVTGNWIGTLLDEARLALALPWAMGSLFFPQQIHRVGASATTLEAALWLVLASIYALAALLLWRQVRAAGGWRQWHAGAAAGDGKVLRSQLLLLGTFTLAMTLVHLWKSVLVFKMLVAALPALALCVGSLGAGLLSWRPLALAGLSLVLATVSVATAFLAQETRWLRSLPHDRTGVREIIAREVSGAGGTRVFCWEDDTGALSMHGRSIAQMGRIPPGLLRTAALRPHPMMADARHLIPPFYFANVYRVRGGYFRKAGLQVEYLPASGQGHSGNPWAFTSFLVTEPAGRGPPAGGGGLGQAQPQPPSAVGDRAP